MAPESQSHLWTGSQSPSPEHRGITHTPGSDGDTALPAGRAPSVTPPTQGREGGRGLSSILSTNIRGLSLARDKTKPDQLGDTAKEANAAFIALTETWLTSEYEDAEVQIPGYTIHRADRAVRARGGYHTVSS